MKRRTYFQTVKMAEWFWGNVLAGHVKWVRCTNLTNGVKLEWETNG